MGYLEEARLRAKRRRSSWNLLLIPAVILPLALAWYATVVGLAKLHLFLYPERDFTFLPDTVGGILMAIGSFFAWLAPSMIAGNMLVYTVPSARRALEAEAKAVPSTDFVSANRGLVKAVVILTPVGLGLSFLGALVGW